MKFFHKMLIACLPFVCGAAVPSLLVAQSRNGPPNIVFIMADDMGYGDVGCYNPDSKIPTPAIDSLATEGIRFTDAHSPSAVCTPTRYGLLTGRYCWRSRLKSRVLGGYSLPLIETDRVTVASFLKQHGYATACIGKWHLGIGWKTKDGNEPDQGNQRNVDFTQPIFGGPTELGFDYFFGTAACCTTDPPYCFIENDRTVGIPNVPIPREFDADRGLMVPNWSQENVDPTFVRKATEFLEQHARARAEQPFFLYLPLSAPHAPWLPPKFVQGRSEAGLRGDQVVLVDWCVGQIVDVLDRLALKDNTLLIFTSDNGPRIGGRDGRIINGHKSAGDLRGYKSHVWDGGHREPFIARWPGKIKPGTTSDEVICLTDLMATCAAILDTDLPEGAGPDSYNILPALVGEPLDRPIREAIVHHSVWGAFAIRQGPWKAIFGTRGSGGWVAPRDNDPVEGVPGQLYNMADDPGEQNNLWDERSDVVARLSALLKKYKEQGHSQPAAM